MNRARKVKALYAVTRGSTNWHERARYRVISLEQHASRGIPRFRLTLGEGTCNLTARSAKNGRVFLTGRKLSRSISQLYSPKIFTAASVSLWHKNDNVASFPDPGSGNEAKYGSLHARSQTCRKPRKRTPSSRLAQSKARVYYARGGKAMREKTDRVFPPRILYSF